MSIRQIFTAALLLASSPVAAAERSFLVGSFDELIVEGDMQVSLATGKPPSGKATGDKDRLNALKIDRQGKTVRIYMTGLNANRALGEPLKIELSGRDIRKLIMRGNGKISATDMLVSRLQIEIRGSGAIDIANVKNDRIDGLLVGSGKLNIGKGTVLDTEFLIDGAPTIAAAGATTDKLRLQQNGPANTHFTVKRSAEITNSGSGSITIDGDATCFVRRAGGASIKCKKVGS
jgi:hypothetical protein